MKSNIYYLLEYSSLVFVLSYLTLHSIQLVFIGILLSLYLINKSLIDKSLNFNKKQQIIIPEIKDNIAKELSNKSLDLYNSETISSLVETVEELGFIPSKDEGDYTNAAKY